MSVDHHRAPAADAGRLAISCNAFRLSGGLERYAVDVVGALNRLGIRPVVFARRFDAALLRDYDIEPHRINVGFLPGKWRDGFFSWRVKALKKRLGIRSLIGINRSQGADLAICGGTHRGFLRALSRRPGFSDQRQITLEAAQYAGAQRVVAHSAMMIEELRTLYALPASKLALLYPPVDQQRFTPVDAAQRASLRAAFGLPEDKAVFVFPSSSHERKGYAQLAAFFEQTALPVLLVVVGRPVSSHSPAIRYLGYQSNMADVYRAADYSVLASLYEPFGLVGIESALCDTPSVLARGIACTEVLSEQACLRFDGTTPGDLARVMTAAVARWQAAGGGVTRPSLTGEIHYDTDIDHHVRALLSLLPA